MKIAVVGAGIVGVSIAAELASRGAEVVLLDRNPAGSGTSSTSFAWVNSNNKHPDAYYELNLAGMHAHHKLAASDGEWFHPTGHVELAVDSEHRKELQQRLKRLASLGYITELPDVKQTIQLIPDLLLPGGESTTAFYPLEAHIDPVCYVEKRLEGAVSLGVTFLSPVEVQSLEPQDGGCLLGLDDGNSMLVDRVVSATGRWTNEIARLAGLPPFMLEFQGPGDPTMGYLAVTNPLPLSLSRVLTSPRLNVRPAPGGRLILQALDLDATAEVGRQPAADSSLAQEYIYRLREILGHTSGARIDEIQVARRAIPRDGLSIIGAPVDKPWLYLVATHSGVTLAPFLGERVAAEIFGNTEPLFDSFRPDRLLRPSKVATFAAPRRPGEQ
ncbi:NAD(P)/FAD-dependent oxidoreductase [Paeniglutamicibacter psychrophenolicus]|uniref:NAD(P)/FAD-dependent oxidoreductase n=1 Tax=Paeniglutamicibacter psychrophenolicus TaxID=257454 RepID=UPI00278368F2|nr:FAD-binding oxidoreductase [Paeniglutamicibacter psychrophenolicus]MDQ0093048.1 glycine/D-amino acid oxidase-like deaminating enzyme [Paeniglutamicibacter psychrophenolicus]